MDQFTLPENFYNVTSSQLLLAPDHMFLYARLLKAATQKDLATQNNGGIPLHWDTMNTAGDTSAYGQLPERGRLLLSSDLPDIFGVKVDLEGQPGNTIKINRPLYQDTVYTMDSRRVGPNGTISTQGMALSSEQNDIMLERFVGPYNVGISQPGPYIIDRLMAKNGVHSLISIAGAHMKRDYDASLDYWVRALLDTGTAIYPSGMTAVDDATAANQFPMDLNVIARLQEDMDTAKLPTLGDGCRILVVTPTQKRQLSEDPIYRFEAHDHPQFSSLMPGYVAKVKKFHIFESTNLTTTKNTNNIPVHRAHAIAPGALGVAMGGAPRIAKASDTNYDEQAKVVWIAYMGLKLMDSRFVRVVATA